MRICLYNTPAKPCDRSFDKVIWCPASRDIVYIIHLFRRVFTGSAELHAEGIFREYLKDEAGDDLTFFDAEREIRAGKERLIAFYSQSDTLAGNTLCLISGDPPYRFISYIPSGDAENADSFFEKHNIPFHRYSYSHLKGSRPDVLVLYNDWTKAAIRVIAHCRLLGIPVVCIQESIVNFGDSFRRMQRADEVMIQGVRSALMIPRRHFYLTGNPRYVSSPGKKSDPGYALINCNFTYGIYDEVRTQWLDDVTTALDDLGIDYLISQHPRDNGDLGRYRNVIRSSGSGLDDQFSRAGLLITRFSSLVHESLIRGVPVIYYNPHHEKMHYDFGFDPGFIVSSAEKDSLKNQISSLYGKNISGEALESYLSEHCLPADTKPVSNINYLLSDNKFSDVRLSLCDLLHMVIYQPFILRILKKIKQILTKPPEPEN